MQHRMLASLCCLPIAGLEELLTILCNAPWNSLIPMDTYVFLFWHHPSPASTKSCVPESVKSTRNSAADGCNAIISTKRYFRGELSQHGYMTIWELQHAFL